MQGSTQLERLIDSASPLVAKLSPDRRNRLATLVSQFISDVEFRGAHGFELTPQVLVTIATHACLLLLNRRQDRYGIGLRIVVHDRAIPDAPELMGRYSRWGKMDLNWNDILRGGIISVDGCNVVMHEFAHRLDSANIFMDGAPALHSASCHATWRRVMDEELTLFREGLADGVLTPLNSYAATNHAEFFACTTEAYFEQPDMLKAHFPRVYERLAHFYEDGA
jgi:MtfA peptidase